MIIENAPEKISAQIDRLAPEISAPERELAILRGEVAYLLGTMRGRMPASEFAALAAEMRLSLSSRYALFVLSSVENAVFVPRDS